MVKMFCFVMALVCIALGLYYGIYVCFFGGVLGIIEQVKAPEINNGILALSIVKIFFCTIPMAIGFWFGVFFCGCGLTSK